MQRFSRFLLMAFLFALTAVTLLITAVPSGSASASTRAGFAPGADCTLTPIAFSLSGVGTIGASRPFSVTTGDAFAQFVAPPITATNTSAGYVTVNDNLSGTVSGGITGTFTISNLDGLLITNPEGPVTTPRGMQLNEIVITGATGTITAVMAVDFAGLIPGAPYPRTFNAYMHSTSTSGSFAPYRYVGAITFGTMTNSGSALTINGASLGTLYTGSDTINQSLIALRSGPSDRATGFEPTDIIAQVRRPDFAVGSAAAGHVNPLDTFAGTTTISNTGGFALTHNSLLVDGGPNTGKGWLAGGFNFADADGNIIIAPFVSDLTSGPFSTSLSGYVFKAVGTGVYTDSIFFANVNGTIVGNTAFGGTLSGVFCAGSQLPTPTVTVTPQTSSTSTQTAIASSTAVSTASTTGTSVATFTTPSPSSTNLPPTNTGPPRPTDTMTVGPTSTPTGTVVASATSTVCPIQFTDVPETHTFYPYVRCLACRGVISGYNDGTFKPDNLVTRGQLAKIVSNAGNFQEDPGPQIFNDVPESQPFYPYINRLTNRGYMSGYTCGSPGEPCPGSYFRPYANATRGQTSKIVSNAAGFSEEPTTQTFEDVLPSYTFYKEIERLASRGIMGGYECGGPGEPCGNPPRPYFRPGNNVTRGQSAKIVAGAFFPNCQTPSKK